MANGLFFGSANWDARSLRLNFEFNVECYSPERGRQLKQMAQSSLSESREFRNLLREGRISLVIGLSFLALCLSGAEVLAGLEVPGTNVLQESLTICGWVAMWHPMETYLYRWWPLRREGRVFRKLSTIPVEVRYPNAPAASSK